MERIHKKLGVTLFGRGGERKWVLFNGEPCDFHIVCIYEDGYLRIRLRGGGIKSKLRHFTPRRPADLKPRILAFQSCVFKIEKK